MSYRVQMYHKGVFIGTTTHQFYGYFDFKSTPHGTYIFHEFSGSWTRLQHINKGYRHKKVATKLIPKKLQLMSILYK